ncbi:hypothetical protein BZZ01_15825 [Nostocales cyanobacterium HT-58-2]|nr:hypothetical protein BZZ01_15825 [Nostocales cyanobacterium HT-58-2]
MLFCGALVLTSTSVRAQITPDNTLGAESSLVRSNILISGANGDVYDGLRLRIEGGARRGSNLFHSFSQFNINDGQRVYFANPNGVENILTRVTGGQASNILGTLGTEGSANLFLINPNGIVFGPNARLDVGGSFVATTANAVRFGEMGNFSATNPEAPPLLTIKPDALLFNQITRSAIVNNSVAPSGLNPSSSFIAQGLRVPDGKSLLLVGGDIQIDSGNLYAFGGRVELGGLAGAGTVGLNEDAQNLSLSFPNGVERSDVSLSNGAQVDVTAGEGGSIAVNARTLEMTGGSALYAGIESGMGSDSSQAGNIDINATAAVNLNNMIRIFNAVLQEAKGQGGDVNIRTSKLQLQGISQVGTATFGAGKGGSLTIDAQDIQLTGTGAGAQFPSGLFASAEQNSTGDAGNLTIKTNSLLVDGALVTAGTSGAGKGGSLTVQAQDIQLVGRSILGTSSQPNSTGDAGNLTIKTNSLLVKEGSQVAAITFGRGKGGSLTVQAQDVQLIGGSGLASGIFASADRNATGDAGNLTIKTDSLLVKDGAQVLTATFGPGKGGSLIVEAQDIQLTGTTADEQFPSGIFTSTERNSTGDAGNLIIKTDSLLVKDGAQVGTGTFGAGKGGYLTVDASNLVEVVGSSANDASRSAITTSTKSSGDAGDLTLNARRLIVRGGGFVAAATAVEGTGSNGNLVINVKDSVEITGFSNRDGRPSSLSVLSRDQGKAGNLTVNSPRISVKDQGTINAESFAADGGNITLNTDLLLLRRGGTVSATAGFNQGAGNGGNIAINARAIAAVAKENSDIRANAFKGKGGNLTINTEGLFGIVLASFPTDLSEITASSELGVQGQININQPELQRTQGIIELPSSVIDASTQIAQVCPKGPNAKPLGEFIITGRGSLSPSPFEPMTGTINLVGLATLDGESSTNARTEGETKSLDIEEREETIIEAQGWVRTTDGQIALVARASGGVPNSFMTSASCPVSL